MDELKAFFKEETAISTVEIVLIIVVLVALVVIFKKSISDLVKSVLDTITTKSKKITG